MAEPPTIPGQRSQELAGRAHEVECPAFFERSARRPGADPLDSMPIVLARGDGVWLEDADGNRYLDFAAGFGSALLGHGHPRVLSALREQSARLVQGLGDVYPSDVKVALMAELAALHPSGRGQVILTQSGSDAVTAALKTATLATERHAFIAFDGAYHGLGHGPLAACGFSAAFRAPFAPQLNPAWTFCPHPGVRNAGAEASLAMVKQALRERKTAAVLVEPIIGRGGCVAPPPGFLRQLSDLAHAHGALFIADEIWTGLGRAGAMLRCEVEGAEPDIVCLGKGLGGGLPISACIASRRVMAGWADSGAIHTSTHAGWPLGCAAALAVLAVLREDKLPERARETGNAAVAQLRRNIVHQQKSAQSRVVEVRGAGLMIGVELDSAATAQRAIRGLLRRGFIVVSGGIDGATLTLTPPLTIAEEDFVALAEALAAILSEP